MNNNERSFAVPFHVQLICATLSIVAGVGWTASPACAQSVAPDPHEASFMADNNKAMTTMMNHMSVQPTGDVDRDFVAMMQPHHQGAIDMAQAELRYGHNEQLRRIAQEIIVDQQQEITAMSVAIGQPPPPSAPAPTQMPQGSDASGQRNEMQMQMPMPKQDK
ncbi:DUF305 domain-containing protein [Paraburkholderia sp. DHOC27]|uniref:DUF305 domain-containing protein n=1 Tax=Paraburkholderia sp. DHOC27 TaxID=2303330 RepID=UPI000E3D3682|nr:DUF305 domain-containing protein [Paraburkholderia sp. DHOC27]RFU49223.1 DUF305 domain-containing protein [Paraburkholderia sp. DHOC27]